MYNAGNLRAFVGASDPRSSVSITRLNMPGCLRSCLLGLPVGLSKCPSNPGTLQRASIHSPFERIHRDSAQTRPPKGSGQPEALSGIGPSFVVTVSARPSSSVIDEQAPVSHLLDHLSELVVEVWFFGIGALELRKRLFEAMFKHEREEHGRRGVQVVEVPR
jgi:hypothetical protein